jgi:heme/copper-type cytochrome/quinol oxidase subunit 4
MSWSNAFCWGVCHEPFFHFMCLVVVMIQCIPWKGDTLSYFGWFLYIILTSILPSQSTFVIKGAIMEFVLFLATYVYALYYAIDVGPSWYYHFADEKDPRWRMSYVVATVSFVFSTIRLIGHLWCMSVQRSHSTVSFDDDNGISFFDVEWKETLDFQTFHLVPLVDDENEPVSVVVAVQPSEIRIELLPNRDLEYASDVI